MAISKEQWAEIKLELSHPHGVVELDCDGYRVSLQVERVQALKYEIAVYVNGFMRGAWLAGDSEEGRRFLQTVEYFVNSAKARAALIKIYGGKRCKKDELARINKKFSMRKAGWTSVTSLSRHYVKNNQNVSLISIGYGSIPTGE